MSPLIHVLIVLAGFLPSTGASGRIEPDGGGGGAPSIQVAPGEDLAPFFARARRISVRRFDGEMGFDHQHLPISIDLYESGDVGFCAAHLWKAIRPAPSGMYCPPLDRLPLHPCNGMSIEVELDDGQRLTLEGEHWSGGHQVLVTAPGWDTSVWYAWNYQSAGRALHFPRFEVR